jgi:N-acetylglutamate synthase-like GNAT family acetyltransferase
MKIRQLEHKDVITASKLVGLNYSKKYENSSKNEIEAMFTSKVCPPKYIVAEENGRVIGFAGYIQSWMDYHIYQIFWVNVKPGDKGKGIGTKMIKEIIKTIKKEKCENKAYMIQLTTTFPKFYKRLGFKKINEFKKKHYLMSLELF